MCITLITLLQPPNHSCQPTHTISPYSGIISLGNPRPSYSLNQSDDNDSWDAEPFPVEQLFETVQQIHHLNKRTMMVFIIFCAHEKASHYAEQLKQDPQVSGVSFGAMQVECQWTMMQQWVVNNWESYLIICCGGVATLTFNCKQDTLLPYTTFTVPAPQLITRPNSGQKPLEAMK